MAISVPRGIGALWSSVTLVFKRWSIQWSQFQVLGTILRFPFPTGKTPETPVESLCRLPFLGVPPPHRAVWRGSRCPGSQQNISPAGVSNSEGYQIFVAHIYLGEGKYWPNTGWEIFNFQYFLWNPIACSGKFSDNYIAIRSVNPRSFWYTTRYVYFRPKILFSKIKIPKDQKPQNFENPKT